MTTYHRLVAMPAPGSWADRAACKGRTDEFFADTDNGHRQVPKVLRDLCSECPVHDPCLAYALTYNPYGIWAGTSWRQRNKMTNRKGSHWPEPA